MAPAPGPMLAAISVALARKAIGTSIVKPSIATAAMTRATVIGAITVVMLSATAITITTAIIAADIGSSGTASGSGSTAPTTTPMATIAGGFAGRLSPPEARIGGRATTRA